MRNQLARLLPYGSFIAGLTLFGISSLHAANIIVTEGYRENWTTPGETIYTTVQALSPDDVQLNIEYEKNLSFAWSSDPSPLPGGVAIVGSTLGASSDTKRLSVTKSTLGVIPLTLSETATREKRLLPGTWETFATLLGSIDLSYGFGGFITPYRPAQDFVGGTLSYAPFMAKVPVAPSMGNSTTGPGIRKYYGKQDLIEINLQLPDAPSGQHWELRSEHAGDLQVLTNLSDSAAQLLGSSGNSTSLSLTGIHSLDLYVKWTGGTTDATCDLALVRVDDSNSEGLHSPCVVTFHRFQSVIIALGGLGDEPNDTGDPYTQVTPDDFFRIPRMLYRTGWDVRMYDQATADTVETSPAYLAVVNGFAHNAISNYGIFGFSMGGGKTYNISKKLREQNSDQGPIAAWAGYLDGVQGNYSGGSESRAPISTKFFNYYEHAHPGGLFLRGVYIDGANSQMDVNDKDSGIGHFTLPLRGWIQNDLIDSLEGTMTR